MNDTIKNRYEFVILFDVENGNPNGDPDAGNMPRVDFETGHGIITDVCTKRKIRNYVEIVKNQDQEDLTDEQQRFHIYVTEGAVLNRQHEKAYTYYGLDPQKDSDIKDNEVRLRRFMCNNFYDIRAFGAVMTTKVNCGQVRGPVQLNFARSIDPIVSQDITITRMAVTTEEDAKKKVTEMGRKSIIPYGLYRQEGYISAALANNERKGTGFSEEDLELLWEAIESMFEHDHSAARGKMTVRKLIIFKHDSQLGNAPSHVLLDKVKVDRKDKSKPARNYNDYIVTIDRNIPEGVTLIERV
jgi:CRISPR-associated protein Csd2